MKRIAVLAAVTSLILVAGLFYRAQAEQGSVAGPTLGDLNCSGVVDSIDALLVLQYVAGYTVKVCVGSEGDVNRDGAVNAVDAALILQYEAGLIPGFAPGVVEVCHGAYPTVCIPPPPPVLDCDDIEEFNFPIVGEDPHNFDSDGDGIGCEVVEIVP